MRTSRGLTPAAAAGILVAALCGFASGPLFAFDGTSAPTTDLLSPGDGLRGAATAPDANDKAKALTALQYAADQGRLAARNGKSAGCTRLATAFRRTTNALSTISARSPMRILMNCLAHRRRGWWPMRSLRSATTTSRAFLIHRWCPIRRVHAEMFAYAASYLGDADAQYQLGRLYLDGTPNEAHQAARWFQLSASKGDCQAEAVLGDMLFQGQKVPRQAARGLMWLTLSKDCAGPEETWVKPLYDNAFHRANDDERALALVYLENWMKGRRE